VDLNQHEKEAGMGNKVKLSSMIGKKAVIDISVRKKSNLFKSLAEVVIPKASRETVNRIYDGIQEREAAMNTYVGNGVAIPHAYIEGIEGLHLAMARNPKGFPYEVVTDEPVVIVVLVVGSKQLQNEHLSLLSTIAEIFIVRERRNAILYAPNPAAAVRFLDAQKNVPHRKIQQLTRLLLFQAYQIAQETGIKVILTTLESDEELSALQQITRRDGFIVATSSPRLAKKCEKIVDRVLLLPKIPYSQTPSVRLKFCMLMAPMKGIVSKGNRIIFISGNEKKGLDTISVLKIGKQFGNLIATDTINSGIQSQVLERVITLNTELGTQGREGRPIGALFCIVGKEETVAPYLQQMIMNPFHGYSEGVRNILDPTLSETIKEFAFIDGAFIIRGDGVFLRAGVFIKVDEDVDLPGGYGSRHRVACAITKSVNCMAVTLSQSTGEVNVFKNGLTVLTLPRSNTL
jgi:DNA integrity scanning protein DisA with diadenylate cyclase activity/mannitol/fructose-specific phosphotransferase system IIA component (Ntr-type)